MNKSWYIGGTMIDCFCWLSQLIGKTPLTQIKYSYKGEERVIYAKLEQYNLTGSIKDRIALHILHQAIHCNELKPGDTIVEVTSGNTGISFSAVGKALGYPVTIYMPDWLSSERINLIKSYGAKIELVSREDGGFLSALERAKTLSLNNPNIFLPSQFSNQYNIDAHYHTTAREIWSQMTKSYQKPDAFVAGVGTGGTVMGVGKYFKEKDPTIKIYPLEPANSPTLSTGCKVGKHRIQGISDDFIPDLIDFKLLDDVISVDDGDSIIMAQKLACSLGMGVGISSGANFIGAVMVQNKLGKDAVVVTVFPDDNKKYLSTELMHEESIKSNFLSPDISDLSILSTACLSRKSGVIGNYKSKEVTKIGPLT
jgi:cysteine synthase